MSNKMYRVENSPREGGKLYWVVGPEVSIGFLGPATANAVMDGLNSAYATGRSAGYHECDIENREGVIRELKALIEKLDAEIASLKAKLEDNP